MSAQQGALRVSEIWRYPVKSMGGEQLRHTQLTARGIPHDRGWAVRDAASGAIRTARQLPQLLMCLARCVGGSGDGQAPQLEIMLPDGSTVSSNDAAVDDRLSRALGQAVTLAALGDSVEAHFFDAFPLSILTTSSIRHLQSLLPDEDLSTRRFRANLIVDDAGSGLGRVERRWVEGRVRLGDAALQVAMDIPRCVMIGLEQPGLRRNPGITQTVVREMQQVLGVYCRAVTSGDVRIGDVLSVSGQQPEI